MRQAQDTTHVNSVEATGERSESSAPWVYYVVPNRFQSAINPVQLTFRGVANVVTFRTPKSPANRIRSIYGRKQMRTEGALGFSVTRRSPSVRAMSMASSLLLRNTIDRFSLSSASRSFHEPDLIFVYDVFQRISGLNNFDCPKAYFVGDASISVDRYFELAVVQDYDYVFVAQKDYVPLFRSRGCKNVIWLPFGVDPEPLLGPRSDEVYDFSFIGSQYARHSRGKLLKFVKSACSGMRFFVGNTPDMGKILRESKISLQISVGDVLGQRVFEVMAAGTMLVADRIDNGLFDLFAENVHLACYSSPSEMVEKLRYYVAHDDERKRVARAGQVEVMAKHTMIHRANTILKTCIGRDMSALAAEKFPWFRGSLASPKQGN